MLDKDMETLIRWILFITIIYSIATLNGILFLFGVGLMALRRIRDWKAGGK